MRISFLLLTLLYLSACNHRNVVGGAGQQCATKNDCSDRLLCVNKVCTLPLGSESESSKQAPRNLRYAQNPVEYFVGMPIQENQITYDGEVNYFGVYPDLPSGLKFDLTRGTISGTPTMRAPRQVYTVMASNDAGGGNVDLELAVLALPQKPSPRATAYYQNVNLSWQAVDLASTYTIYWNTTGNVTKNDQKFENIAQTSFVHITPLPVVTYYYRIAGVGSDGEGELSDEVTVMTYGVTMVSGGGLHTCATVNLGSVRCWGFGSLGRLGYGNNKNIGTGIDDNSNIKFVSLVGDVPVNQENRKILHIAAGGTHTCAILEDGQMRCWGYGEEGQLGYGNKLSIGWNSTDYPIRDDVPVGEKVAQIALGGAHTCALLVGGRVRCWGLGGDGQLGYGNTKNIGTGVKDGSNTPTIHDAGDIAFSQINNPRAVQITAGASHTCALLESGGVRCWGQGRDGRLGYGNTKKVGTGIDDNANVSSVSMAGNVPLPELGNGKVIQIAAGGYHTCALIDGGQVRCWGYGSYGQLGYGNKNNIGDTVNHPINQNVPVGGKVVQISAGMYHTCAVLDDGGLRCWGSGDYGELGYGSVANIGDDPIRPIRLNVPVGAKVKQVSTGDNHTCAVLEGGRLRCWGNGEYGRLGYGNVKWVGAGLNSDYSVSDISIAGDVPLLEPFH